MQILNRKTGEDAPAKELLQSQVSRRGFLRFGGILGASALVVGSATGLTGCSKDDDNDNSGVNLGSGDVGILNYAYALEQLEAAFYTQVIATPFTGITTAETSLLTDIRDHEVAHREFFKTALGSSAIQALQVDFSSINFTSRASVLATAKAFEDLGVSAYNGAGKLLADVNNLLIAGKIVSVEARHAAWIRELLTPNSATGSDVVNVNGLDLARTPAEVLSIADPYIVQKLNASNLPTS